MLKEGLFRNVSGCAISGIVNRDRKKISGEKIIKSIAQMRDRSNGLGGGFAAYGIYPQYKDFFAFHIFYDNLSVKKEVEVFLDKYFDIESEESMPVRQIPSIVNKPIIWRYFVKPLVFSLKDFADENDFVANCVIKINKDFDGAYIFSSGKNMGAFKGVGYPEDIGEFFMLDSYEGYIWTAHGRFPTNTPGWWGGAHPFTMLDWSVVHNGEISSYDANRRFVEMFGYKCSLQTDTEVIAYLFDLLVRKHKLSLEKAVQITASPFWKDIERENEEVKEEFKALRAVYSSALINGPFSIILGFENGILALNDRIKLRPLIVAEKGDTVYLASEESAIKIICRDPDKIWAPDGGEPVIVLLNDER
ncbi:MAG: glutamine amidotransferase family protein [Elusimicrobiota bacterium]|jgi:glutamate synthase domain-containing protein 1|nr:glutamine amidotransferase family protein [Elusimicrobiota bacterium]